MNVLWGGQMSLDCRSHEALYYYFVGGGLVERDEQPRAAPRQVPLPFTTGAELLQRCAQNALPM